MKKRETEKNISKKQHTNNTRNTDASCNETITKTYTLYVINVQKLQFIHTVNGDGSKTAKIIKRQC